MLAPEHVYAADDYWYELMEATGKTYREVFDITSIGRAHTQCLNRVAAAMARLVPAIAVANTNVRPKDFAPYVAAATVFDYRVHYLTVERPSDRLGDNLHGVPEEAVGSMLGRWRWIDPAFINRFHS